jgi:NTE family protein
MGGGARGAYQAGALRAIADICSRRSLPFPILSGISAGAINAVFIASRADDFVAAANDLSGLWRRLHMSDVFATEPTTLLRIGTRLLAELSLGSLIRERRANYLLDTTPLQHLLAPDGCNSQAIRGHLADGILRAVAVTATDYQSGNAVTFFDSDEPIEPWVRSARLGVQAQIGPEHALASSAMPIFFPPVEVDGRYFGDGGIGMRAPLSTVIHLDADRILAIGHRSLPTSRQVVEATQGPVRPPALASVIGLLLNALLLDGLEVDVERLERVNRTVSTMSHDERATQPLRVIPLTVLRPSVDLGDLASELLHRMPLPVRHLLRGLGATEHVGRDLLSYLLFDQAYTTKLLDLGYRDTMAARERVEGFFVDA